MRTQLAAPLLLLAASIGCRAPTGAERHPAPLEAPRPARVRMTPRPAAPPSLRVDGKPVALSGRAGDAIATTLLVEGDPRAALVVQVRPPRGVAISPSAVAIPAGRSALFSVLVSADASPSSSIAFDARTEDGELTSRRDVRLVVTRTAPAPELAATTTVVREGAATSEPSAYVLPAITQAPQSPPSPARVELTAKETPVAATEKTPVAAAGPRAPVPALVPAAATSSQVAPEKSAAPWIALVVALVAAAALALIATKRRHRPLDTVADTVRDDPEELYVFLDSTESLVWDASVSGA